MGLFLVSVDLAAAGRASAMPVTIGGDHMPANMDYNYLWYISCDEGQHWTHAEIDLAGAKDLLREPFTLASGRQIYLEPKFVSPDLIDTKPSPVDSSVRGT